MKFLASESYDNSILHAKDFETIVSGNLYDISKRHNPFISSNQFALKSGGPAKNLNVSKKSGGSQNYPDVHKEKSGG